MTPTHFTLCLDPTGNDLNALPRIVVAYALDPSARLVAVIRDPHHHMRECVEKLAGSLGVDPRGFTLGPVLAVRSRAVSGALRFAAVRKLEVPNG